MTCNFTNTSENYLFNEAVNCERKMQNGANLLRSLIKQRSLRLFVYNFASVLLFIASRDWETVKNVVPGNS